ncbi:MAG: hypothetical protein ACXU8N_03230 [Telluria sp.]
MSRRLFTLALLALPLLARAADASFGSHGMVLFGGRDGLYASHLPMFHSPHDTQVVLRVHFTDARLDRAMRASLDGGTRLWTLDPAPFALARLAPHAVAPLVSFTANVVEGHFEQGGQTRHARAAVVVDAVLLYRPLSPAAAVRPVATYVPIGPFLVKLVDARPDFDHIVRLRAPAAAPVSVAKPGMTPNLEALRARLPMVGTIYFSPDDLH